MGFWDIDQPIDWETEKTRFGHYETPDQPELDKRLGRAGIKMRETVRDLLYIGLTDEAEALVRYYNDVFLKRLR